MHNICVNDSDKGTIQPQTIIYVWPTIVWSFDHLTNHSLVTSIDGFELTFTWYVNMMMTTMLMMMMGMIMTMTMMMVNMPRHLIGAWRAAYAEKTEQCAPPGLFPPPTSLRRLQQFDPSSPSLNPPLPLPPLFQNNKRPPCPQVVSVSESISENVMM